MSSEGCKCGSNCNCSGCSCEMDVQKSTTAATIEGVAPVNMHSEGSEKSFGAEGCKCGSGCTCNPCNC